MRWRVLDVAAILVSFFTIGAFSLFAYNGRESSSNVVIEASGTRWIYPIGEDRQVRVSGPLGEELIEIKDGNAWVVSSPCPNKLCILQGRVSKSGQWIACLPNRVFIQIAGGTIGGSAGMRSGGIADAPDDIAY